MVGRWRGTVAISINVPVACSIYLAVYHTVQSFTPFSIGEKDMEYKSVAYMHFALIHIKTNLMAVSIKFVFIFTITL